MSLQCPTTWPHNHCCLWLDYSGLLLAERPHFDKRAHIIGFHPSFAYVLQHEGKPSCPVHEYWRARLIGTLLFQQNRTRQCCWLLCYIFPDRALAIKIDAIIHMDSAIVNGIQKAKPEFIVWHRHIPNPSGCDTLAACLCQTMNAIIYFSSECYLGL